MTGASLSEWIAPWLCLGKVVVVFKCNADRYLQDSIVRLIGEGLEAFQC